MSSVLRHHQPCYRETRHLIKKEHSHHHYSSSPILGIEQVDPSPFLLGIHVLDFSFDSLYLPYRTSSRLGLFASEFVERPEGVGVTSFHKEPSG